MLLGRKWFSSWEVTDWFWSNRTGGELVQLGAKRIYKSSEDERRPPNCFPCRTSYSHWLASPSFNRFAFGSTKLSPANLKSGRTSTFVLYGLNRSASLHKPNKDSLVWWKHSTFKTFLLSQIILSGIKVILSLLGNGGLRPSPYQPLSQITHKPVPVYQNNSFYPVIRVRLSLYWVASSHPFDLPNYPFIRIIHLSLLTKYSFRTKKRKDSQSSPSAQCQNCFNDNSAQEISLQMSHPHNYPRRVQNALSALGNGIKKSSHRQHQCCRQKLQNNPNHFRWLSS